MNPMVRVGISDPNELFRYSLESYLNNVSEISVEFNVGGNTSLRQLINSTAINVLIFDLKNNDLGTIELLKYLQKEFPFLKIIILTHHVDESNFMDVLRSGIHAYFTKEIRPKELITAIIELSKCHGPSNIKLGPIVREKIMNSQLHNLRNDTDYKAIFSDRELEILKLVCQQNTNQQISEQLNLSKRTVEEHRRRMIEKTSSKNFIGVLMFAIKCNTELLKEVNDNYAF